MDELVEPYLKKIPLFSGDSFTKINAEINIQPLAGLTNQNFLLSIDNSHYVLRIPRQSTHSTLNPAFSTINRGNEAFNERIAQNLGLAPQVIWREENAKAELTGVSLSDYLKNTTVPTSKNIHDSSIMAEIVKSLKSLHNSNKRFKGAIDNSTIKEYLKHYFNLCSRKQQTQLLHDYRIALHFLQIINDQQLTSYPLVPSHIDLVLDNILIDNSLPVSSSYENNSRKIWLIDWEYSAMASPFWDIAMLSNAAKLCDRTAVSFMKKVFTDYRSDDVEMLRKYRCIVKAVSDCWHAAYTTIPHST